MVVRIGVWSGHSSRISPPHDRASGAFRPVAGHRVAALRPSSSVPHHCPRKPRSGFENADSVHGSGAQPRHCDGKPCRRDGAATAHRVTRVRCARLGTSPILPSHKAMRCFPKSQPRHGVPQASRAPRDARSAGRTPCGGFRRVRTNRAPRPARGSLRCSASYPLQRRCAFAAPGAHHFSTKRPWRLAIDDKFFRFPILRGALLARPPMGDTAKAVTRTPSPTGQTSPPPSPTRSGASRGSPGR